MAGLEPNKGQKAALDSFQGQQKPFGWLMEMIQHITGSAQNEPQQPAQPQAQPSQQPQQTPQMGVPVKQLPNASGVLTPSQSPAMASTPLGVLINVLGSLGSTQPGAPSEGRTEGQKNEQPPQSPNMDNNSQQGGSPLENIMKIIAGLSGGGA